MMKRLLTLLALGASVAVVALPAASARGDELPHLEFVRGLRERNFPDLALEYLEQLSKQPNLPKQLKDALAVEMARTHLDIGAKDPDPSRRARVYEQARLQMEAYLKTNPPGVEAAIANLDLARIYSFQAKATLEKANQSENPARDAGRAQARKGFAEAHKRITDAYDRINALLVNDKTNQKLSSAKLDAEYERAVTSLNLLFTYASDKDDPQERAAVGTRAIDELKVVANRADRTGWMGMAMLIRAYDELDSFDQAEATMKRFDATALEPGKRMAQAYYFLLNARKDLANKKVRDLGLKWLKEYRAFTDTPEGIQVRYQVAASCLSAAKMFKDPKATEAKELYDLAEKYFEEVEHTESEWADRARNHKVEILVTRRPDLREGDINKLESFDVLVLRAQMEVAKINDDQRKEKPLPMDEAARKKELERRQKELKAHYQLIIDAVTRGMTLADDSVPAQKLIDARFLLIYYLLQNEDLYPAVIHGEDLARSNPGSSRAGMAGAYALGAYAQLIYKLSKDGGAEAPEVQADRARMKNLAEYLEANWKNDIVADEARFQMGALAVRAKDYPQAVAVLSRVTPAYPNYTLVLYQIGQMAHEISAEEKKEGGKAVPPPPRGHKTWGDLSIDSFRKIPIPKSLRNAEVSRYYFMGKATLAYLLFAEKKLDEVDKLTAQLTKDYPLLPPAVQADVEPMLAPLPLYTTYGKADLLFKSNDPQRYTKVITLLGPLVQKIAKKELPEGIEAALPRIILFLYLKSCLLEGKIAEANKALETIQAGSGFENQGQVLAALVKDLSDQIAELKKKGGAGEAEYKKAKDNFAAFLDTLAKQDLSKIKPEQLRFLAFSYGALERYDVAAGLLKKIPEPPSAGVPAEEFKTQLKTYHAIRLLLARMLRLSKQFEEAAKVLKEIEKGEFATRSLEYREEGGFLLEDRALWGAAANAWKKQYEELGRAAAKNARLREPHQQALYHYILCLHKYALQKQKPDFTKRAANMIFQLEKGDKEMGGLKDQYADLLKKEPALKEAYDDIKKKNAAAAGAG